MEELKQYCFTEDRGSIKITKEDIPYIVDDVVVNFSMPTIGQTLKISIPTIMKKEYEDKRSTVFDISHRVEKTRNGCIISYADAIIGFLDELFKEFAKNREGLIKKWEENGTAIDIGSLDGIIGMQRKILLIEKIRANEQTSAGKNAF